MKSIYDPLVMAGYGVASGQPINNAINQAAQYAPQQNRGIAGFDDPYLTNALARGMNIADARMFAITQNREAQVAQQQQQEFAMKQNEYAKQQLAGQLLPQIMKDMDPTDIVGNIAKFTEAGLTRQEAVLLASTIAEHPFALEKEGLKQRADAEKAALDQEKEGRKTEEELRKEHTLLSKKFKEVDDSYARIKAISKIKDPSGIDDKALIFAHMNMIDPGARVTDSDYATTESARGMPDYIMSYWRKVMDGDKLTDQQRKEIFRNSISIHKESKERQKTIDSQFDELATDYGVSPKRSKIKYGEDEEYPDLDQDIKAGENKMDIWEAEKKRRGL